MTRLARRLAWCIFAGTLLFVLTPPPPGPSWAKAIVALAVIVAAWVLLRDELDDGPDDTFARIVHPSAWGCDADDWQESADGIEGRAS